MNTSTRLAATGGGGGGGGGPVGIAGIDRSRGRPWGGGGGGGAERIGPGALELSIVMPVYNEERALSEVLDEAIAMAADAPLRSEIVLVDDASTDHRSLDILRGVRATPYRRFAESSVTRPIAASWAPSTPFITPHAVGMCSSMPPTGNGKPPSASDSSKRVTGTTSLSGAGG